MRILIISNGSPDYYNFFNILARKLGNDGYDIIYAVDSLVSLKENKIKETGFSYHVFSEYFKNYENKNNILDKYLDNNLNFAMLSDYERADVYNIWRHCDKDYFNRLKSALLDFFEDICLRYKIDVILYENISNSFAYFAWIVGNRNGARYVGFTPSRMPGRFSITDNPFEESNKIKSIQASIESGERNVPSDVYNWVSGYINNIDNIVPDYMKFNGLDNINVVRRYAKVDKIRKIISRIKYITSDTRHNFQLGNPLVTSWNQFKRNLYRNIKIYRIKSIYTEIDYGSRYLLYPLHYHPESSTSIHCGSYLNELDVIRNIAFNLPEKLKLYVKDHPSAWGYPELSFYKKLKDMPNVDLVSPAAPTKELIKHAQAIITLTSTVGYEALLMGKPVILFGSTFYENHRNVFKVTNPNLLYSLINDALREKSWSYPLNSYNHSFVSAYYLSTYAGVLNLSAPAGEAYKLVESIYPYIKSNILENVK